VRQELDGLEQKIRRAVKPKAMAVSQVFNYDQTKDFVTPAKCQGTFSDAQGKPTPAGLTVGVAMGNGDGIQRDDRSEGRARHDGRPAPVA
jgi:hypothetical protein